MDALAALEALERGEYTPHPRPSPPEVGRSAEVATLWARALGLRPGNTRGPTPTALVPVVDRWATTQGLTGPGYRDVGRGLVLAGLMRRATGERGCSYVLLHREDAATCWRLAREAWAPARPPGDTRGQRRVARRPRRARPTPAPPGDFHTVCAQLGSRARPVVDSLGRVWPAPSVAALVLGGARKALTHAVGHFRNLVRGTVDARPLRAALARGAAWRGVWWRYLTPQEIQAVPPGTPTGAHLPGLGWGLTCPRCGACPPAAR